MNWIASHYAALQVCIFLSVSGAERAELYCCWQSRPLQWMSISSCRSCLWLQTPLLSLFSPRSGSASAANRRIQFWSRQMPVRQTGSALGYPHHLQRWKSVPRRSLCLLLSHRWGMRQPASRHAKSVAWGRDTPPGRMTPVFTRILNT